MAPPFRKPDFIVVGAPRCGTTALHAYLRNHPQVFVPRVKEPHFFATDVPIRKRMGKKEYLALFQAPPRVRRVGEVSVWYLYSERSAQAIQQLLGPIQIIAMLRNPIEAMASLHGQYVYTGDENIEDFEQALGAEADRIAGREPRRAGQWVGAECLCYRQVYRYSEQVQRYFDLFGRDQVHVVLYDDFARQTEATYGGILDFLGLDSPPRGPLSRVNAHKKVRWRWLSRLHRRYERPLRRQARRWIPNRLRGRVGHTLVRSFLRLNSRSQNRTPLNPDLRRRLAEEITPEVRRLEVLLDKDLSSWLRH